MEDAEVDFVLSCTLPAQLKTYYRYLVGCYLSCLETTRRRTANKPGSHLILQELRRDSNSDPLAFLSLGSFYFISCCFTSLCFVRSEIRPFLLLHSYKPTVIAYIRSCSPVSSGRQTIYNQHLDHQYSANSSTGTLAVEQKQTHISLGLLIYTQFTTPTNQKHAAFDFTTMTDHDSHIARGRKRDRSLTRASVSNKPVRADESSTLRGRSRQRATSPLGMVSRNASPSLMSPTRHLLLHNRLRESRREHCPSRPAASPSRMRRRSTRSRSRGPRREVEASRPADHLSGLRNEVFRDGKVAQEKQKG